MTRRTINLAEFWLTIALFTIPSIAFAAAGYLRFLSGYFTPADVSLYSYFRLTLFVTLFWVLIVKHLGLNRIETLLALQTGIFTSAQATVYCAVSLLSVLFFYRDTSYARVFIVIGCVFIFILSVAVLHIFRGVIHVLKKSANGASPVAVLGADKFAARIANHLRTNPLTRCSVACFVALPDQQPETLNAPVLQWDDLDEVVETYHCNEAFLALPPQRFGEAQSIFERVQHLYPHTDGPRPGRWSVRSEQTFRFLRPATIGRQAVSRRHGQLRHRETHFRRGLFMLFTRHFV